MSKPLAKRFVIVPTYMDLFDELACGFGLAPSRESKLAFRRSWQGRQAHYAPKDYEPWRGAGRGLFSELLALLGGDDQEVRRRLANCFIQYEAIISNLRGKSLITYTSYEDGLEAFLRIWVLPQVAVLLTKMQDEFPAGSPLKYLKSLVSSIINGQSDPTKAFKDAIIGRLNNLKGIDSYNFRSAISKIDNRSETRLKTILDQIKHLKDEANAKGAENCQLQVLEIRGVYIAGVAIKRFLRHMSKALSAEHSNSLLLMLFAYLKALESSDAPGNPGDFLKVHSELYDEIQQGFVDFGEAHTKAQVETTFVRLAHCFEQEVRVLDPYECAPLANAWKLYKSKPICPENIKNELKNIVNGKEFPIFRVLSDYMMAKLALLDGDSEKALEAFMCVLKSSTSQQIGQYGVDAACAVIALKLKRQEKWVNGYLDPQVAYLAENITQVLAINVAHPTPFSTFSDQPKINDSSKLIFEAIALFNLEQCQMFPGSYKTIYNPFESFDKDLENSFRSYDKLVSSGEQPIIDIQLSYGELFGNINKFNSVLRFCSITPYEFLRDAWFFVDIVFSMDMEFAFTVCPGLYRYLSSSDDVKLCILKTLDAAAYIQDELHYSRT